jgi:hypothetical protein
MFEKAAGTLEMIGLRDRFLTSEYRIFGPPGTGKTRSATRHIRRAVDRFSVNSGKPRPMSFQTRSGVVKDYPSQQTG